MTSESNLYSFHNKWKLIGSIDKVWQVLTAEPFSWEEWWPSIRHVDLGEVKAGLKGTTFKCVWQAIGYKISADAIVEDVVNEQKIVIRFSGDGDIEGTAICNLKGTGHTTLIDFELDVKTNKKWMNYLAPLIKPLFILNHHHIMNSGERGLQKYIL